jgi:hypothetical protein
MLFEAWIPAAAGSRIWLLNDAAQNQITPLQNEVVSHVNDFCMMKWGVTKENLRANLSAAYCSREPNLAAENQVKKNFGSLHSPRKKQSCKKSHMGTFQYTVFMRIIYENFFLSWFSVIMQRQVKLHIHITPGIWRQKWKIKEIDSGPRRDLLVKNWVKNFVLVSF